jgi:XTP/dITP diphosphohydrolase
MQTDNVFLFATGNRHKRREFEELLDTFLSPQWKHYDLSDWPEPMPEIEEDADTFVGNALKKAGEASRVANCTAMADDSGLEVDALDGRPGVYSARFAGEDATDADNNVKLIEELQGVPEDERTARYVCVTALAISNHKLGRAILRRLHTNFQDVPAGDLQEEGELTRVEDRVFIWFKGTVEGRIIDEARGDGGFGYDPHFYVPQWDKTMAEVPLAKKNSVSHRAEAARKLEDYFPEGRQP